MVELANPGANGGAEEGEDPIATDEMCDAFIADCEEVLEAVKRAQRRITRKRLQIPMAKRYYWRSVNAWDPMEEIYSAELRMLGTLINSVSSRKGVLTERSLGIYSHILREADSNAQAAKAALPEELLDPRKSPTREQQEFTERTRLRYLASTHWDLVDHLTKITDDIVAELSQHAGEMRAALEQLSWLFTMFVSYAGEDRSILDELREAIEAELTKHHIRFWWDEPGIRTADQWKARIEKELDRLDVGLMLVSKSFQSSDFIKTVELPWLLKRRSAAGIRLFSIVLDEQDIENDGTLAWLKATQYTPRGDWVTRKYQSPELRQSYFTGEVLRDLQALVMELSDLTTALKAEARF
jgi:hypothetical protein